MEREYRGALDVQRESERAGRETERESITSCSERERGREERLRERVSLVVQREREGEGRKTEREYH